MHSGASELAAAGAPEISPDARSLEIRPVSPGDKQALLDGFERLSEQSRYRRFLSPHGRLTPAELRYFTAVDHHDHEALVALDPESGEGVGVARFVRSTEDPTVAEVAIAVVDDWQRRGVGTRLAGELARRAREEGISAFTGLVLADNDLMLNLIRELGRVHAVHQEHGTVELTVDLPETGVGHLRRTLRAIAGGELRPFPGRHRAG